MRSSAGHSRPPDHPHPTGPVPTPTPIPIPRPNPVYLLPETTPFSPHRPGYHLHSEMIPPPPRARDGDDEADAAPSFAIPPAPPAHEIKNTKVKITTNFKTRRGLRNIDGSSEGPPASDLLMLLLLLRVVRPGGKSMLRRASSAVRSGACVEALGSGAGCRCCCTDKGSSEFGSPLGHSSPSASDLVICQNAVLLVPRLPPHPAPTTFIRVPASFEL